MQSNNNNNNEQNFSLESTVFENAQNLNNIGLQNQHQVQKKSKNQSTQELIENQRIKQKRQKSQDAIFCNIKNQYIKGQNVQSQQSLEKKQFSDTNHVELQPKMLYENLKKKLSQQAQFENVKRQMLYERSYTKIKGRNGSKDVRNKNQIKFNNRSKSQNRSFSQSKSKNQSRSQSKSNSKKRKKLNTSMFDSPYDEDQYNIKLNRQELFGFNKRSSKKKKSNSLSPYSNSINSNKAQNLNFNETYKKQMSPNLKNKKQKIKKDDKKNQNQGSDNIYLKKEQVQDQIQAKKSSQIEQLIQQNCQKNLIELKKKQKKIQQNKKIEMEKQQFQKEKNELIRQLNKQKYANNGKSRKNSKDETSTHRYAWGVNQAKLKQQKRSHKSLYSPERSQRNFTDQEVVNQDPYQHNNILVNKNHDITKNSNNYKERSKEKSRQKHVRNENASHQSSKNMITLNQLQNQQKMMENKEQELSRSISKEKNYFSLENKETNLSNQQGKKHQRSKSNVQAKSSKLNTELKIAQRKLNASNSKSKSLDNKGMKVQKKIKNIEKNKNRNSFSNKGSNSSFFGHIQIIQEQNRFNKNQTDISNQNLNQKIKIADQKTYNNINVQIQNVQNIQQQNQQNEHTNRFKKQKTQNKNNQRYRAISTPNLNNLNAQVRNKQGIQSQLNIQKEKKIKKEKNKIHDANQSNQNINKSIIINNKDKINAQTHRQSSQLEDYLEKQQYNQFQYKQLNQKSNETQQSKQNKQQTQENKQDNKNIKKNRIKKSQSVHSKINYDNKVQKQYQQLNNQIQSKKNLIQTTNIQNQIQFQQKFDNAKQKQQKTQILNQKQKQKTSQHYQDKQPYQRQQNFDEKAEKIKQMFKKEKNVPAAEVQKLYTIESVNLQEEYQTFQVDHASNNQQNFNIKNNNSNMNINQKKKFLENQQQYIQDLLKQQELERKLKETQKIQEIQEQLKLNKSSKVDSKYSLESSLQNQERKFQQSNKLSQEVNQSSKKTSDKKTQNSYNIKNFQKASNQQQIFVGNENSQSLITVEDFQSDRELESLNSGRNLLSSFSGVLNKQGKKIRTQSLGDAAYKIPIPKEDSEKKKKKHLDTIDEGNQNQLSFNDTNKQIEEKYLQEIKKIKEEEVKKWEIIYNQLKKIEMKNQKDIQQDDEFTMLKDLIRQTEMNKNELLQKYNQDINENLSRNIKEVEPKKQKGKVNQLKQNMESWKNQKQNEINSNQKYIDLNSYNESQINSGNQSQQQINFTNHQQKPQVTSSENTSQAYISQNQSEQHNNLNLRKKNKNKKQLQITIDLEDCPISQDISQNNINNSIQRSSVGSQKIVENKLNNNNIQNLNDQNQLEQQKIINDARLVLGSEQLLRETISYQNYNKNQLNSNSQYISQNKNHGSQTFPAFSNSCSQKLESANKNNNQENQQQNLQNSQESFYTYNSQNQVSSAKSVSLFNSNSFQDFTKLKIQNIVQGQGSMSDIVKMREDAIEKSHEAHKQFLQKMLDNKRVSPKTFQHKTLQLELWVTNEKQQLKKNQKKIEKGWQIYEDTIKQTKRDLILMDKINNNNSNSANKSGLNESHKSNKKNLNIQEEEFIMNSLKKMINSNSKNKANNLRKNYTTTESETSSLVESQLNSNLKKSSAGDINSLQQNSKVLSCVEQNLEQNVFRKISKTPQMNREELINNFQSNNSDLFHINQNQNSVKISSLKKSSIKNDLNKPESSSETSKDYDDFYNNTINKIENKIQQMTHKGKIEADDQYDNYQQNKSVDQASKEIKKQDLEKNEGINQLPNYQQNKMEKKSKQGSQEITKNNTNNNSFNFIQSEEASQNGYKQNQDAKSQNKDKNEIIQQELSEYENSENLTNEFQKKKYEKISFENYRDSLLNQDNKPENFSGNSLKNQTGADNFNQKTKKYYQLSTDNLLDSKSFQDSNKDQQDDSYLKNQNDIHEQILQKQKQIQQEISQNSSVNLNSNNTQSQIKNENLKLKQSQNSEQQGKLSNLDDDQFKFPNQENQKRYEIDDFEQLCNANEPQLKSLNESDKFENQQNENKLKSSEVNIYSSIESKDFDELSQNKNYDDLKVNQGQSKQIYFELSKEEKENKSNIVSSIQDNQVYQKKVKQVDQQHNEIKIENQQEKSPGLKSDKNNQLNVESEQQEQEYEQQQTKSEQYQNQFSPQELQKMQEEYMNLQKQFQEVSECMVDMITQVEANIDRETRFPGLSCVNLNSMKDFLVSFAEFLRVNNMGDFLEKINVPKGMDAQEFLKTFNISDNSELKQLEPNNGPIYNLVKFLNIQQPVVPEQIFEEFVKMHNQIKEKSQNEIEIEKRLSQEDLQLRQDLENIHLKMVYDILNESLDALRPFGLPGKPFPWKLNSSRLSYTEITEQNMDRVLGLGIAKILKWGSFLCGFIPERNPNNGEALNIDDEYLNQIKEQRLAQMLENEVIENEEKWLCYDEEEADVQLELADDIFDTLVTEMTLELYQKQFENKDKIPIQVREIINQYQYQDSQSDLNQQEVQQIQNQQQQQPSWRQQVHFQQQMIIQQQKEEEEKRKIKIEKASQRVGFDLNQYMNLPEIPMRKQKMQENAQKNIFDQIQNEANQQDLTSDGKLNTSF